MVVAKKTWKDTPNSVGCNRQKTSTVTTKLASWKLTVFMMPTLMSLWNGKLTILKMILQWGTLLNHDDVIKWEHFPHYWLFVQGIHWSPVNSPHLGQWHRALMFSLICAWINGWVNNREAGDLRRHHAHYNVTVMKTVQFNTIILTPPEWPNDQIRT